MGKIIYAINISLDGCCDHTKMIANEEVHEYHTNLIREVDVLAFGRMTYQLMVPFWPDFAKNKNGPKSMIDFALAFDAVSQMVVFSRSLEKAEGKNTRIIRTELKEELLKLKEEQGKTILVGGVDIPSQLIELGLIDEYRFVVQPILVGEGRRILGGVSLQNRLELELLESKIFSTGSVAHRYIKR